MKKLIPLFVPFLISGCVTLDSMIGQKTVDDNLVGIWNGEYDKQDGSHVEWTQVRNGDGRYLTFFKVRKSSGDTSESVESGNWWVEDRLFHEINPKWAKQPFAYKYTFYNADCLKFEQSGRAETANENGLYSFTECKKRANP